MKKLKKGNFWNKLFFIGLILLTNCKTIQYSSFNTNKFVNKLDLLQYVSKNKFNKPYKFNYNLTVKTENDSKHIKGLVKIYPDSVLWMNIVAKSMGIELGRILLENNNLNYIDRINKQYFKGDFEYLNRILGIHANMLGFERILTGQFYLFANNGVNNNIDWLYSEKTNRGFKFIYHIDSVDIDDLRHIKYPFYKQITEIDNFGRIYSYFLENINNGNKFFIQYEYDKKAVLPSGISVSGHKRNADYNYNISIDKFEENIEFNYKFDVPGVYTPLN
jgi:hypothetical protein